MTVQEAPGAPAGKIDAAAPGAALACELCVNTVVPLSFGRKACGRLGLKQFKVLAELNELQGGAKRQQAAVIWTRATHGLATTSLLITGAERREKQRRREAAKILISPPPHHFLLPAR